MPSGPGDPSAVSTTGQPPSAPSPPRASGGSPSSSFPASASESFGELGGPRGTSPHRRTPEDAEALRSLARDHLRRVAETSDAFFEARADDISRTCRDMAERFRRGGRLLVFAPPGSAQSDAFHVSVEFVHPVLVGKRALPATVLAGDAATRVESLGRPEDIALGITAGAGDRDVVSALRAARDRGLLTLGLGGGSDRALEEEALDHVFVVPDEDPLVVQQVQETLYHVLWELVHVFFEHEDLG